jgi:hypothetical protein
MDAPMKKRRWFICILLVLVVWQVVPAIISRIGPSKNARESVASLSATDQKKFDCLIHPDKDEIRAAGANIEYMISSHSAAMSVWREAIGKLCAGATTVTVTADLSGKLPQAPPSLAQHYELSTGWLGSDFWRRDREEFLINALNYGYRDAALMDELKNRLAHHSTYSIKQVDAYVFALIQERRFDEAIEVMSARVEGDKYSSKDEKQAVEDLRRLRANPDDLESNLAIKDLAIGSILRRPNTNSDRGAGPAPATKALGLRHHFS